MIDDAVHVCDPRHWADRDSDDTSRYWVLEHSTTLKTRSCHDANFVNTGDTTSCSYDNVGDSGRST